MRRCRYTVLRNRIFPKRTSIFFPSLRITLHSASPSFTARTTRQNYPEYRWIFWRKASDRAGNSDCGNDLFGCPQFQYCSDAVYQRQYPEKAFFNIYKSSGYLPEISCGRCFRRLEIWGKNLNLPVIRSVEYAQS